MADRIKGITVEIGGDTGPLANALKSVNQVISSTSAQLRDVDRMLKLDPGNVTLLGQKADITQRQLQALAEKERMLKQVDEQLKRQLAEGKISTAQYEGFQRELVATQTKIKQLGNESTDSAADVDKLTQSVKGVSAAKGSLDGLAQGFTVFKGAMANLVSSGVQRLGGALGGLASESIGYQAQLQNYTASFTTMTGSAQKASEITSKLQSMGASTPFEMPQLAETTQLLMNYGFTADDAMSKMSMLGDISQGNAEKLNSVAMAYGQMSSAGKVSLEDVKQMIEAGFNPLQEISQTTGESMTSLYDRISNGTLSVDEITASMQRSTSEGGKYFQSMQTQSKTFEGQLSTLKDNIHSSFGTALSGVFSTLTDTVFPKLNATLQNIDWQALSKPIGDAFNAVVDFASFIINNFSTIGPIITGIGAAFLTWKIGSMLTPFISGLSKLPALLTGVKVGQEGVNGAMRANPILAIISLITMLVSGLISLWNTNEGFRNAVTAVWNGIKSVFSAVIGAIVTFFTQTIPSAIQTVIGWFQQLPQRIGDFFTAIGSFFAELPGKLWGWLTQALSAVGNWVSQMVSKALEVGGNFLSSIGQFFMQLPGNIWNWLVNTISNIGRFVSDLGKKALEAGKSFVGNLVNTIKSLPGKMLEIGKNIVSGIWSGISGAAAWLWDKITGWASSIVDGIKGFFGIHSPSTLFRDEVGKNLALGLGEGFTGSMRAVAKKMQGAVPTSLPDVGVGASALTRARAAAGASVSNNTNNTTNNETYHITVNAGQTNNPMQLAQKITENMEFLRKRRAAAVGA